MGFITAFHLGSAAVGHSIYRDIHIGTALVYAKGPINLLKPVIVGFNLNGTPTPQELPVWQAAAGLAFKMFGAWFGWANLVSLIFMFSCLYPLFNLAERFAGPDCAWWTLVLFLAQPLIFIYAGEASPDGMSLALSVWFLFFAAKLWEEQKLKWLVLTGLTGALAAVSKLPFFMAAGLGCFFMTLANFRQQKPVWVYFGLAAFFIGAVFLVWTRYVNHCYEKAELPLVDLRISNDFMKKWYFGDLKYWLSASVWVKGAWRILTSLFGSFALVALFLVAVVWQSPSRLACWWILGGLVTTVIFFHLVLQHAHYYLMLVPGVAILCAQVAARLEAALLAPGGRRAWLAWLAIMFALVLSTVQGALGSHIIYDFDKYPYVIAGTIKQHTSKSDKVVIQGGGWGGQMLFLAGRNGLSTWTTQLLENRRTYDRLKEHGFTKLVMVSESPLLAAIRHVTSTSPAVDRQSYRENATPIVDTLPTILQTDDILIKELP